MGQHDEAIAEAIIYLNSHPNDSDVRLLLGQLYFYNKDYLLARQEVLLVVQQNPNDLDATLVLINVDTALNNDQEALDRANFGLMLNPTNPELLKKKDDLLTRVSSKTSPILLTNGPTTTTPATSGTQEFKLLDDLYVSGLHTEAIYQSIAYLKEHPTDSDVRLMLGKFYFFNKDFVKAREELLTVLQQNPHYIDARLILINVEITSHHYQEALTLADNGLLLDPKDSNLLIKKKSIVLSIASETGKHQLKKTHKAASIKKIPAEKKYLNEIGTNQQQYYVSDKHKVWDYSQAYYGRETTLGKVYAKLNYDSRLTKQAFQGELEAYPKINKYLYLDLDIAYANQPNLFPDRLYGAEAYVTLAKLFNFSLGGKYNFVDKNHQYTLYTGSISKDIGSNRVLFRPMYYVPGVGRSSLLYTIDLRHTVLDPYYYFGCVFGYGTSPDLASLTTVNFIVVKNKIISPYLKFPLYNDQLIVGLNLLYQNQVFEIPSALVRNWGGGTISLAWKY